MSESVVKFLVVVEFVAHDHKGNRDGDHEEKANEQYRGVKQERDHKSQRAPEPLNAGQGNSKRCRSEGGVPLPQRRYA